MGKGSRRDRGKTKTQRKEQVERKRDERSQRNSLKKEKQANQGGLDDGTYKSFRLQLQVQGFKMRDVTGDGNCLFRALADQFDGNQNTHQKHRRETVSYMKEHEDDFIPFIEETVTFDNYLKKLSSCGTYGGNDSIVAFARNHGADIIIHQHNNPTFIVEGSHANTKKIIIHLAYHDFEHYSSVRRASDPGTGPACLFHNKKDSIPTYKNSEEDRSDQNKRKHVKKDDNKESVKNDIRDDKDENEEDCNKNVTEKDDSVNEKLCNGMQDDDYIEEAVDQLRQDSGCQDTDYIKSTLVDNDYDTSAALGFILQTLCLCDDSEQSNSSSQLPETVESDVLNKDEHEADEDLENNESSEDKPSLSENTNSSAQESHNISEEDDSCNSKVIYNEAKNKCSCDKNERRTCDSSCSCKKNSNNEKNKGLNKERKKQNADRPVKKPTNRQRKEMAKQARKKRRQESRHDSHSSDTQPVEKISEGIKSINI